MDLKEQSLKVCSLELLRLSKESSERRGSFSIRERDVKEAIEIFKKKMPSFPQWYTIPVAGNGSCLFTSLRICMELNYLLSKIDSGEPPDHFVLDGHHDNMLKASFNMRLKIVDWFRKRLDQSVPQLGNYIEGPLARPYVRGDLLALEMVRSGKDVPENGAERESIILKYLVDMSAPDRWGSTPEYTAAACMTGKTINIWQRNSTCELSIINSVNGSLPMPSSVVSAISCEPELIRKEQITLSSDSDSDLHMEEFKADKDKEEDASEDAVLYEPEKDKEKDPTDSDSMKKMIIDQKHLCESFESDSDSDDEQENLYDRQFNLLFRGNHYQPLVTRFQYLKLISCYGIDAFQNFREF